MEQTFAKDLVVRFNKLNGKRHNPESQQLINQVEKAINTFGQETVTEIIETVREDSIYKVIDVFFIKDYVRAKQPKEEVVTPVQAQVVEEKKSSDMTLGLIEQALAQVIADKYVPKITDDIKVRLNEFITKNGKLEKKNRIHRPNKGKMDETVHEEFETVVNFVMNDEPVMLVGPAGSGKNVLVKQVAKLLNLEFYFTKRSHSRNIRLQVL